TATELRLTVSRRASSGSAAIAAEIRATPGVYTIDRSSRLRKGCFAAVSITPPRCIKKVRSDTLRTATSSVPSRAATTRLACSVPVVAQVKSMRKPSPDGVTSRAVTKPPASSTVLVSALTAEPPEGTSMRTVIEYEMLGALIDLSYGVGYSAGVAMVVSEHRRARLAAPPRGRVRS